VTAALPCQKLSLLDRLYWAVSTALDRLIRTIGLSSSSTNENKILIAAPITASGATAVGR
jgi:hypothetical protein